MNLENWQRLRDAIEHGLPDVHFNMEFWCISHAQLVERFPCLLQRMEIECGTVCCIAGHAQKLRGGEISAHPVGDLADFLEIDGKMADLLSRPHRDRPWLDLGAITREEALQALDNMRGRPEVDPWDGVLAKEED